MTRSMDTAEALIVACARHLAVSVHPDPEGGYQITLVLDRRAEERDAKQLARFYAEWVRRIIRVRGWGDR